MERVTEWLRRGTRDLGVWGSIHEAPVRCKNPGQALNPHRLWPPSSNGYLVHRFKVESIVVASFSDILAGEKGKVWLILHRDLDVEQIPFFLQAQQTLHELPSGFGTCISVSSPCGECRAFSTQLKPFTQHRLSFTWYQLLHGGHRRCRFKACPRLLHLASAAGVEPQTSWSRVQYLNHLNHSYYFYFYYALFFYLFALWTQLHLIIMLCWARSLPRARNVGHCGESNPRPFN